MTNNMFARQNVLLSCLAAEFYYLERLAAALKYDTSPSPAVCRLRDDVMARNDFWQSKLAEVFIDYLTLICAGEARHGWDETSNGLVLSCCDVTDRIKTMKRARGYDRMSILSEAHCLFIESKWSEKYGGSSWARIARVAMDYLCNGNKQVFIDTTFDIVHNGGDLFNKKEVLDDIEIVDDRINVKHLLDIKKNSELLESEILPPFVTSPDLSSLIMRASALGIAKIDAPLSSSKMFHPIEVYVPIKFGDRMVRICDAEDVDPKEVECLKEEQVQVTGQMDLPLRL
jgi:hypothetical protein